MSVAARPAWRGALVLWLLLLALCGAVIARASFVADLSAFLPSAPDARQRLLIEQIQAGVPARSWLLAIEGGDEAARAAASRALAARLRASDRFTQVLNGEREALADVGRWVVEQRYLLSPAVTPERFTAAGLTDAVQDTLALLGTPAGALVKPLLARDPSGETQRMAADALGGGGPRVADGVWVGREAPRALLLAPSRAAGGDLDAQQANRATIDAAWAAVATPGLVLRTSGSPVFSIDSRARIEREARQLAIAGLTLALGLLWLAFRRPTALALAWLPVATGVVVAIAAVALGFGRVHGITLGFGSTLVGEAVDYAIYYLVQARQGAQRLGEPGRGWRAWLKDGWPTLRLGLLTSVAGFAALMFSGFEGLAQLGVFSIAGLIAAALTARFVLPVLAPDGMPASAWLAGLGRRIEAALGPLARLRWPALGLALAALAVLLAGRATLWQGELSSLSPIPPEALAYDAALRADLGEHAGGGLIVVTAADREAALQQAEAVGRRLDAEIAAGRLGGYDTPTRLAPSMAAQRARQAALPEPAALAAAVTAATTGTPLPAARLAPFLADVEAARRAPLLDAAALAASPAALAVEPLLLQPPGGGQRVLMPLRAARGQPDVDLVAVRKALAQAPGVAPEAVTVLRVGDELRRTYRHYLGEALRLAGVGMLAVALLVAGWLRSLRRTALVLAPLALAVVVTMAGLHLAGIPLSILHLVGLLLVVAVGSNYALFFDLLAHDAGALGERASAFASLALANLTTVGSFALIAISGIPALGDIGRAVAPGALLALVFAAVLIRPPRAGHVA